MNSNRTPTVKKPRQGRADKRQKQFIIDWLASHPHVAQGKFTSINGKDDLNNSWGTLVEELNKMGPAKKDERSWKNTWRDIKSSVSLKIGALKRKRRRTGNPDDGEEQENELTEEDRKVLGIVGMDYVDGVQNCPDSSPENAEILKQLMAADTEEKLEEILQQQMLDETLQNNNHQEIIEPPSEFVTPSLELATPPEFTTPLVQFTPAAKNEAKKPKKTNSMTKRITPNGNKMQASSQNLKCQRLGAQFHEARIEFQHLQENQLEIMRTFAKIEQQKLEVDRERLNVERETARVLQKIADFLENFNQK